MSGAAVTARQYTEAAGITAPDEAAAFLALLREMTEADPVCKRTMVPTRQMADRAVAVVIAHRSGGQP